MNKSDIKRILRKKKKTTTEVIILIIALVVSLVAYFQTQNRAQSPTNVEDFEQVKVTRVVDGDTIEITKDDGSVKKVRLIGVNTPELPDQFMAKEAKDYTESVLLNKNIYMEKDTSETDKYDRLLRYIWLEIPKNKTTEEIKNKMFNADLVIKGYAKAVNYAPDSSHKDLFKELENEAKEQGLGVFSKDKTALELFFYIKKKNIC